MSAIRAFEAAGRHENFSRAAEELGMTQAAISYQIRHLEDRVGKLLFIREKGRVRLTDTGKRLLGPLSSSFAGMADAFAALQDEDDDILELNSAVSFGGTWLSSRIGRFQVKYPDLAVRISLSNEMVDLSRGGVDAAIRGGRGPWEGMRSDFLVRMHFTPICTPQFLADNHIRRPEDLLNVDRFAPNDSLWAGWFAIAGLGTPPPRQGIVMDSQLQEAAAMLSGSGISMMTPMFWQADLDSGRLVQPFDIIYLSGASHWLVHPANRVGVRKIERFREWMQDELAADRGRLPQIWEPLS